METKKMANLDQIKSIISIENSDLKNENANMNGNTPSGQMMKFASITSKDYALEKLVSEHVAKLHNKGLIHIHDLDYYPTKSATCVQYDLEETFEKGFRTKNGLIRTPQSIGVYAELAAIVFQTAQNEMHGGQAVPAFDYFMAPGVVKSYNKIILKNLYNFIFLSSDEVDEITIKTILEKSEFTYENAHKEESQMKLFEMINSKFDVDLDRFKKIIVMSEKEIIKETEQAMEGFIYNLNTQHSRGGNQVVFSSINLGTDRSKSGRLVMKALFKALRNGLGNGETSIFPIVIFKVKDDVNYDEADVNRALNMDQNDWNEINDWKTPNFDLFLDAVSTTSQRLFPNFMFLDAPYNKHEKWKINDPQSWKYEVATMGCRTRVFENIHGEKSSVGRGNISFTSLNLPFIALELLTEKGINPNKINEISLEEKENINREFIKKVKEYSAIVADQLLERYNFQKTALAKQFPFLYQNNILKGGKELGANDSVEEVLKQGSLTIGFVGLAEALKALTGFHHGESESSQEFGLEIVGSIKHVTDEYKSKYNLNYGVIATPAESVAGRMAKITQSKFGVIPGVTERTYFTNSNHVPVYYNTNSYHKIKVEAAYHPITLGGSISYIELDGEARKNLHAVLSILKSMHDNHINYGSLNHPVDRCKNCQYTSLIKLNCPNCDSNDISRTRRITGYLVGDLDGWNSGKQAEEKDRVKHSVKE